MDNIQKGKRKGGISGKVDNTHKLKVGTVIYVDGVKHFKRIW